MDIHTGHVMNLANSIIGVSILAMPYCFQQCGIVLSILLLVFTNILSRLTCHFLLKSALLTRRKNFEYLAFFVFGSVGKFFIEVGIVGFLLGTCIAFFVVMGDLGPQIIAEITGTNTTDTMRTSILMALALFCVLPLGLLRNVDSLNGVSKATIGFYVCLILKVILVALPHLFSGDWLSNVKLWKFDGILQCIPIFAMALSCQTQLFEIYQVIPNASLEKMNRIVGIAVNICTCVYICVGLFGYIAFSSKPFTGNILLSFIPSASNSAIKIGFIFSLAFSFPLVIFPCRASLYSLFYKGSYTAHDGVGNYIPEGRFKSLTLIIVFTSLVIGIMIPNIEVVLGLVGSTIGVMICVMFPVTSFICISQKNTSERVVAQIILFLGIIIMVLSTYTNLYAADKVIVNPITVGSAVKEDTKASLENVLKEPNLDVKGIINVAKKESVLEISASENTIRKEDMKRVKKKQPIDIKDTKAVDSKDSKPKSPTDDEVKGVKQEESQQAAIVKEIRHEPPQPVEPAEGVDQPNAVDVVPQFTSKPNVVIQEEKVKNPKALDIANVPKVQETPTAFIVENQLKPKTGDITAEKTNSAQKEILEQSKLKLSDNKNTNNKESLDEHVIIENFNKLEKKIDDNIHKLEELAKSNNLLPNIEVNNADTVQKVDELTLNKKSPTEKIALDGLGVQPFVNENIVMADKRQLDKKNDEVDIEAIKKEETELKEQEKEKVKVEDKEKVLLEALQKQNQVQKELVEQNKKLIKVIEAKEKQNDAIDKEKVEAVRRIESAAKQAIANIGGDDEKSKPADALDGNSNKKDLINNSNDILRNENNVETEVKPIVNAAPLSYQLGLNNVNISESSNSSDTKSIKRPLPLALVMSQKAQNVNTGEHKIASQDVVKPKQDTSLEQNKPQQLDVNNKEQKIDLTKDDLKKPDNESIDKDKLDSAKKKNEKDDVNSIRRDILSHESERFKRDVAHEDNVNIMKSVETQGKIDHVIGNNNVHDESCHDNKSKHTHQVDEINSKINHSSEKKVEQSITYKQNPQIVSKIDTIIQTKNVINNIKKIATVKGSDDTYGKLKISQMLSDPKLVGPDLSLLNVESLIPIKPQTRDLKQAEPNDD